MIQKIQIFQLNWRSQYYHSVWYKCQYKLLVICMLHKIERFFNLLKCACNICTFSYWPCLMSCRNNCCRIMVGNLQFRYTFILCNNLPKEPLIRCDMQQLYWLGGSWTDNHHMFLHQDTLINSTEVVRNVTCLKTISNIEIPAHPIVNIPTRKTVSLLPMYHVYMKWKWMMY